MGRSPLGLKLGSCVSLVLRLPGISMMGGKGTVGLKFFEGGVGGRQSGILALQMISMPQVSTFSTSSSEDGTGEGEGEGEGGWEGA